MLVVDSRTEVIIISNITLGKLGINVEKLFLESLARRMNQTTQGNTIVTASAHSVVSMDDQNAKMEEVLLQDNMMNTNNEIPPIESLFPCMNKLSETEQNEIRKLYQRLGSLLYRGLDPIKGYAIDVELIEVARNF